MQNSRRFRKIARLDIKSEKLLKPIRAEGLRNLGDPTYFSKTYYENNIDEIHFQDIVASLYDRSILYKVIEKNCISYCCVKSKRISLFILSK